MQCDGAISRRQIHIRGIVQGVGSAWPRLWWGSAAGCTPAKGSGECASAAGLERGALIEHRQEYLCHLRDVGRALHGVVEAVREIGDANGQREFNDLIIVEIFL
jgi:hypothetical protein